MPRINELVPDADVLLALDPEELGGLLLQVIASTPWQNQGKFHPNNSETKSRFGTDGLAYPGARQDDVVRAVGEALAWLEAQVLIVPPGDGMLGSQGWLMLSRRGRRLAAPADWESYRKANLLPRAILHPSIADVVFFDFVRGDYASAVFKAFKEVEISVRAAAELANADYGPPLMRKAFSPGGRLCDCAALVAEQEALANLFAGAVGSYKNPHSHRAIKIEPADAVEMILLASHLRRIVDARDPSKK